MKTTYKLDSNDEGIYNARASLQTDSDFAMNEHQTSSVLTGCIKHLMRFSLLFVSTMMLTSCGAIGGLFSYLISLPFKIINTIIP